MKKILTLVLALCMILTFTACGSKAGSQTETASTIKIGLITDVGGINDKSFNQTSWEGLQALAAEDPSFTVSYLESKTDADYSTNINTFMDEGYNLIICGGFMLAEATLEAAKENPEQLFAILDDNSIDLPNVACLTFAQQEVSYLVGLIAGSVTESGTVGYVQGKVNETMNLFGIGYVAGVKDACPDATILQYNANSFDDIAGGATAAKDMITNGADVIYHTAGSTGIGVINTCGEADIWAIGVDADQSELDPDHVITSAMKRMDVAAQDISKAVKNGTFTPGIHMYDLSNGGVDIAPTRDHIPAGVLEAVEAARAAIIVGKKVVPTTLEECPDYILDK